MSPGVFCPLDGERATVAMAAGGLKMGCPFGHQWYLWRDEDGWQLVQLPVASVLRAA